MKAFHSITFFLTAASLYLLPAAAQAGPDDAPRPRRLAASTSTRPAPPAITVQTDSATMAATIAEDERPIQPLRQREESVHFRIAYKLLNEIGFTGTEGDRRKVGYQQIYGPPPMLIYQRPPGPTPRRFPHFSATEDAPEKKEAAVEKKDKAAAEPVPDNLPTPTVAGKASPAVPEDADADAGVLPDAASQAAKNRNEEMLSYFQRPGVGNQPQNGGPVPGAAPQPYGGGEADYLRAPEQLPIPPSRATYRVVPK